VRTIADADPRSYDQSPKVLFTATPIPTREQRLWAEEVARVFAAAPTLEPAARCAVRATLHALACDPLTDEGTRADAAAMLTAIDRSPRLRASRAELSAAPSAAPVFRR
jgi:hypothetical protein